MYTKEYVLSIAPKHKKPASAMEWTGYWTVMAMRSSFDLITGYKPDKWMSAPRWLTRILFLETVAGAWCLETPNRNQRMVLHYCLATVEPRALCSELADAHSGPRGCGRCMP